MSRKSRTVSVSSVMPVRIVSLVAETLDTFESTLRSVHDGASDAVRSLAVTLAAASVRKDCRGYVSPSGKGFYAWYLSAVSGHARALSKGRVSQLVTYGGWIDVEADAGTRVVTSEYAARTIQSLYAAAAKATEGLERATFLRDLDPADVAAAIEESRTPAPKSDAATDTDGDTDTGDESDGDGKAVSAPADARALAAALRDMVAAALAAPGTDTDARAALYDALTSAAELVLAVDDTATATRVARRR